MASAESAGPVRKEGKRQQVPVRAVVDRANRAPPTERDTPTAASGGRGQAAVQVPSILTRQALPCYKEALTSPVVTICAKRADYRGANGNGRRGYGRNTGQATAALCPGSPLGGGPAVVGRPRCGR